MACTHRERSHVCTRRNFVFWLQECLFPVLFCIRTPCTDDVVLHHSCDKTSTIATYDIYYLFDNVRTNVLHHLFHVSGVHRFFNFLRNNLGDVHAQIFIRPLDIFRIFFGAVIKSVCGYILCLCVYLCIYARMCGYHYGMFTSHDETWKGHVVGCRHASRRRSACGEGR
jgi:hypothetical protein